MEVNELYGLCTWFIDYAGQAQRGYQTLQKKLQNNATQPQKLPVKEELHQLLTTLRQMPMQQLTAGQIALLEESGVDGFIGHVGARNLEKIVKSARFDPASAHQDIGTINNSVNATLSKLTAIQRSLSEFQSVTEHTSDFDQMTIRIHFQNSASISDVSEWKTWSDEWYDIIRGIALCVDEAPENVRVLGAHQGSVILVLGATAGVTGLLLLISNHLTKIALNGLKLANAIEDLKHKTSLNRTIREALEKEIPKSENEGVKELLETAKKNLPKPINGEQETALKKSIEKYQKFTKKGGEVDFLSPPSIEEVEENKLSEAEVKQIENIRENVHYLREAREETRLLTSHPEDEDEDFEDEDLAADKSHGEE